MIISADNPIKKPEDDALGREKVAQDFVEQVIHLDATEGVVVGVLGPWGSGKTSFINLASIHLKKKAIDVFEFNPWMFSGDAQLLDLFFHELSIQLRMRPDLANIGKEINDYAELFSGMVWIPVVGPWLERARGIVKIVGKMFQRNKSGIKEHREKVESALRVLTKPLAIVIDDIDRLTINEIKDIFKLVRLTANFPNIIYILAFDRHRVEKALSDEGLDGRTYLEKILQVGIDLPIAPPHLFDEHIFKELDKVLSLIVDEDSFDVHIWPAVFIEIVRPLLRNIRDVRRYVAGLSCVVPNFVGKVAIVDVFAIEAIRIFIPDVFTEIANSIDALTKTIDDFGRSENPNFKNKIDQIINAAGDKYKDVVHSLIEHIFPLAARHIGGSTYDYDFLKRWLIGRRIAHKNILRFYLERVNSNELSSFINAEEAFDLMDDANKFDTYMRSIAIDRRRDVISALETFEDKYAEHKVIPGIVVLLNILPELPERKRGFFGIHTDMVVTRVVYRLIRSLKEESMIQDAVRKILPQVISLSAKEKLISIVGHDENSGHKLVSKDTAALFKRQWRDEVRAASESELLIDNDILWVLLRTKKEASTSEPPLEISNSFNMIHAILKSSLSEVRSHAIGSYTVKTSYRIAWDSLIELYGEEKILRDKIEHLRESQFAASDDKLFSLIDKYLSGWRPKKYDTD